MVEDKKNAYKIFIKIVVVNFTWRLCILLLPFVITLSELKSTILTDININNLQYMHYTHLIRIQHLLVMMADRSG